MKTRLLFTALLALRLVASAAQNQILGWNNLGMHCMDSDYSVFSILPPYNTIEAQLIVNGALVTSGAGYTVTYEAIPDPTGSINTSSIGKGNWADFESIIYGAPLGFTADQGLAGWNMPGPANTPQTMLFENNNAPAAGVSTPVNWFRAEGIPLMPYDDAGNKNPYPMMRLVARDGVNNIIATNDIVLPVSDEMDCRVCHAANSGPAAMPSIGWITDTNKNREYRLNILAIHDDREFTNHPALYEEALAAKGFDTNGLFVTALAGKPMLCAACHSSEALGAPSFSSSQGNGTVPALTTSVHTKHASVMDPTLNITLNSDANRSACYRCHPGSTTRCLRGAMGSAVAADGSMAMQCQSCHGSMSVVGSPNRIGWFMEPNCASCHTGTATSNNGQIRYTSVFTDTNYTVRVPVDQTFSTQPNIPANGLSLYRFSAGHGGLQCEACHGSTHAEFPSSHTNDNIRGIQLQGHVGVMVECTACHVTTPSTVNGGPHGIHPVGQSWVSSHGDSAKGNAVACQVCHGSDYKGTVLSLAQADRTISAGDFGTQSFFRGAVIGCYTCHNGPSNDNKNNAAAPTSANVSAQTAPGVSVNLTLPVKLSSGVTVRIISQPANGTVGLNNNVATYFPFAGFTGTDTFTFAAYNGQKNSALATGTVTVSSNSVVNNAKIANFQPATGGVGTAVTIKGSNFTGASAVSFNGVAASFTVMSSGTIIAGVPAGATTGSISVTTPANTAISAKNFAVGAKVAAPKINNFTPASGTIGTVVTVHGSNLGAATSVKMGNVNAAYTVLAAGKLTVIVPGGATTGTISVTTPGGTGTSAKSFTVR